MATLTYKAALVGMDKTDIVKATFEGSAADNLSTALKWFTDDIAARNQRIVEGDDFDLPLCIRENAAAIVHAHNNGEFVLDFQVTPIVNGYAIYPGEGPERYELVD